MTIRTILIAVAFSTAAACAAAAQTAQPNEDEDCDDVMEELTKLADQVNKEKGAARTPLAICAVNGQILGVVRASREAAAECYDSGSKKRTDLLAGFDKAKKDLEGQISSMCK
jgi:hypothetical protein